MDLLLSVTALIDWPFFELWCDFLVGVVILFRVFAS